MGILFHSLAVLSRPSSPIRIMTAYSKTSNALPSSILQASNAIFEYKILQEAKGVTSSWHAIEGLPSAKGSRSFRDLHRRWS